MKRKTVIITATLVALVLLCLSLVKVIGISLEYQGAQQLYQDLLDEVTDPDEDKPYLIVRHTDLLDGNPHYVGWIDIPGTGISYPMVQYTDNDHYLRRSFDGEYLRAGTIFIDYRCDPGYGGTNTVIYGHHSKDGAMFASLERYMDEDFCRQNGTIHVYVPDQVLVYRIFSVYKATTSSDCFTFDFATDQQRTEWVTSMLDRSLFDLDIDASASDKVLSLVTCTNINKQDRYIVQAVLVDAIQLEVYS